MKNLKVHTETKTRYNSDTGAPYEDSNTWIKDENGNYLCIMRDDKREVAHLFAAAPELLVACEGALVALQLGPHVDHQQAIDYLKEVIKKARGESVESATVEKE